MPRPALIKICEEAFKKYNMAGLDSSKEGRERHHRSIARTFDKVGQNPWSDDMSEFKRHLSELRARTLCTRRCSQARRPRCSVRTCTITEYFFFLN